MEQFQIVMMQQSAKNLVEINNYWLEMNWFHILMVQDYYWSHIKRLLSAIDVNFVICAVFSENAARLWVFNMFSFSSMAEREYTCERRFDTTTTATTTQTDKSEQINAILTWHHFHLMSFNFILFCCIFSLSLLSRKFWMFAFIIASCLAWFLHRHFLRAVFYLKIL